MALFWQIVVFLLVAAALGFVVGWVSHGARAHRGMAAGVADEPDQLRAELAAARERAGSARDVAGRAPRAGRQPRPPRARAGAGAGERPRAHRPARAGAERGESAGRRAVPRGATAAAAPRGRSRVRGTPPPALPSPEGEPDDLKRISGIGPGIEKTLHELGIYHFRQIAQFTPDHVAWIDQRLRFKGRIEREDWIGQARKLAQARSSTRPERARASARLLRPWVGRIIRRLVCRRAHVKTPCRQPGYRPRLRRAWRRQ